MQVINTAVGGMDVTETVEGLERYPVNLRYPQAVRDSLERLRNLPLVTPTGATVPLSQVADVKITDGPAMLQSEKRPADWRHLRRYSGVATSAPSSPSAQGGGGTGGVAGRLLAALVGPV